MQMKRIAGLRRLLPRAELVHLRELDRLGLVLVSALVGCQRAAEPAAGDLDEDTQVDLLLPGVLLDDVDPERRVKVRVLLRSRSALTNRFLGSELV